MPAPKRGADAGPSRPSAKRRAREPPSETLDTSFRALRVDVAGDAPWPRHVYVKVHVEEGGGRPRAAFVTGLPPAWRPLADVLRALMAACGDVETVVVAKDEVRDGGKGGGDGCPRPPRPRRPHSDPALTPF